MEHVLKFLADLAKHNDREWFEKNKSRFLQVKATHEEFVTKLLHELTTFDDSLAGLEPKKLIFRIYRDVRFSKDKKPYKNNFGSSYSSAGKGMGKPGYYLQIEPGNKSFIAAGMFMLEPENLAKIRQEIDYNGDALKKIITNKSFKKHADKFWDEDKLKRAPKGFAEDHPYIEYLKLKSFIVTREFKDTEVKDKKFVKTVASAAKALKPLNDFLNDAIA